MYTCMLVYCACTRRLLENFMIFVAFLYLLVSSEDRKEYIYMLCEIFALYIYLTKCPLCFFKRVLE